MTPDIDHAANTPVLSVENYSLDYLLPRGDVLHVLDNINLHVRHGEVVGLVGESGSGKTTLGWSIMRYLAANAREQNGAIRLLGDDLRQMPQTQIESLRGGRLGMIFQDPSAALNPTLSLGEQITEVLIRHRRLDQRQANELAIQLMQDVELKQPREMMKRYPHQVSGGEKQRILIAAAFACRPACLIFDEPTTALDAISASQILQLFERLREETGVAALYISHDLALVSKVADQVCVLEKGRIIEQAPARQLFRHPQHDYTRSLVRAAPDPHCRLLTHEDMATKREPLLSLEKLTISYGRHGLLDKLLQRSSGQTKAADDINLTIHRGEIVGVVGESGSGKSSLAKALTGLVPFNGKLDFRGYNLFGAAEMDKDYRRRVQMIFQHPDASLNPRQRIGEIIARPLRLYGLPKGETEPQAVARLLAEVRLPADVAQRFPHELSGGQKQRVAIARAFAYPPELVICDEITAALDVSVQATIIELLLNLRRRYGTAYLFITHDLNLIRQIAHRVAVMYRSELLEILPGEDMADSAKHPYTQALLAAIHVPEH
ncbi:ABC transporter ATP-binding protein [Brenneria goodwinii]|uniref:nickel ABC transporter ATP-binding protein NikE n=1 Tax=Brenneria goodwinii TaxID=1109412 RepID=UPI000EF22A0E|nr:ABC transporter ATP-binding protein [Brenneria goodwinii]MCG8157937.1 ABC transporter ATP-binding protein [Brenneria goodwinii]MCG8162529.1 ABC transporter ATP-binding protein [Brenneria goodwinii]MCG8166570.1 ABC transporter ATP-binding protein [Brenneria goodwinii]MCG8172491.1 ABC transporter ATP-binding protein [Brenneria goodwinii]MCG8175670.1 ABC transporter ATP-binding protein [Brenneria goodwinii]